MPRSSGSMMRRQRLGADDEHVVEAPACEHRRADDELVDEAGARGVEVERAAVQAERLADERAGVGDAAARASRSRRSSRSMSSGVSPARLIASAAGRRSRASRWSRRAPAMRRSRMPVRSTIHASLVSTRASRSALVSRPSGTRGAPAGRSASRARSRDAQPRDRLTLAQALAGVREHAHRACRRTGCTTGIDVPGPSTHADRLARVDVRRPSSTSSSGRKMPTTGATIMRSGTSEPLAVRSSRGLPWVSWRPPRVGRCESSGGGDAVRTATSGTVRLASAGDHRAVADLDERVGAERRRGCPSTCASGPAPVTWSARRSRQPSASA